jgi:hypothetical protein
VVTTLANGGFVVAWVSEQQDMAGGFATSGIYAQMLKAAHFPVRLPARFVFRLNDAGALWQ